MNQPGQSAWGVRLPMQDYANNIHALIRNTVADLYDVEHAAQVPILYGGSVDEHNAGSYVLQPEVDGLFIGRAALEADGFARILLKVEKAISDLLRAKIYLQGFKIIFLPAFVHTFRSWPSGISVCIRVKNCAVAF